VMRPDRWRSISDAAQRLNRPSPMCDLRSKSPGCRSSRLSSVGEEGPARRQESSFPGVGPAHPCLPGHAEERYGAGRAVFGSSGGAGGAGVAGGEATGA
jgi:hypothetical protein